MGPCPVHRWRWSVGVLACLLLAVQAAETRADGALMGTVRFERIKGTGTYWTDLHEWNAYLTPSGSMFTDPISYRCNHGDYTFTSAPGNYTFYVNRPEVYARPKLVTDIQLVNGQITRLNPTFNLDYSCYYKYEWPGGWDHTWYQTFIATGTSINKIAYSCAGSDTSSIAVTLLKDTGGNVTSWTPVGQTKVAGGGGGENWVGYRSGQLPTVPGQRYAIRLQGLGGSPAFSPFWRTDIGDGYAGGQAYDKNGNPQNKDLCILVFSDNDGTVIPYMKTTGSMGEGTWWEWQWGQTFKAMGHSLAAVDFYFINEHWNMQMIFKVYATPPDANGGTPANQVGITKRGRGAWEPGSSGCMAVSYAPGEVPLTPGETYYIEMTPYGGEIGYTARQLDQSADAYPYGYAYANRNAQTGIDLSMTIMEYANPSNPPEIQLSPTSLTRSVERRHDLANDTFTVSNVGGRVLYYQITDDANWLSVSPTDGSATDEADTITIDYDTADLPVGSYTGVITVSDDNATNSPRTLTVNLTVTAPAYAPCDYDNPPDGDVDMTDFGHLQACLTGPGIEPDDSACLDADLDYDGDADAADVTLFLQCLGGEGVPADTLCAEPK